MSRGLLQKIIAILALISIVIFIGVTIASRIAPLRKFERAQQLTQSYALTSSERVGKSMITLPDGDMLVGLIDGEGTYKTTSTKSTGVVHLFLDKLVTSFFIGEEGVWDPRLDAIVPMSVSTDTYGGSLYVVIFWDRGDAAIERSYIRIGNTKTQVHSITVLPAEKINIKEEYRVQINYALSSGEEKQVLVPVIDGHFDANGLSAS